MKTYIIATGVIFGLITLAHLWRIVEEPHLVREPWFVGLTILSAALCVVAVRLARRTTPR